MRLGGAVMIVIVATLAAVPAANAFTEYTPGPPSKALEEWANKSSQEAAEATKREIEALARQVKEREEAERRQAGEREAAEAKRKSEEAAAKRCVVPSLKGDALS